MKCLNSIKNLSAAEVKHLWEKGQIRGLILMSLVIQALLTFLAPRRKRNSKSYLMLLIWVLYLSADVVAVYIIGLISSNRNHSAQKELQAFWAPFLLLHLGGPDTITALAMEDNELWRRHALQLATQVLVTIYVFVRSLRHNSLWIPTILMFVVGFTKYYERTCALFYASSDNFRDSLRTPPESGPNYARLMEEYFSAKCAHIPTDFEVEHGRSDKMDQELQGHEGPDEVDQSSTMFTNINNDGNDTNTIEVRGLEENEKLVTDAHSLYERFKPLLADGFLSMKDRNWSRIFFSEKCWKDAYRIMQIELNLIYDVFYTKSFLLQRKRAFARILCFLLVIASLLMFSLRWDFKNHVTDAIITFTLLFGAIALDICAGVMFVLSDWWTIIKEGGTLSSSYKNLMSNILRWSKCARQPESQRWSQSISKYNLLKRCFRNPPSLPNFKYIVGIKYIRDFLYGLVYVEGYEEKEKVENLIKFVMDDLHQKAKLASDIVVAKDVFSARGNLVLLDDYFLASECLSPWTVDIDYDESLLIWHLATDICYWTASSNQSEEKSISKSLSDYMLYLVMWQQKLLSSVVGMSDTRFEDTCAEATKFMNKKLNISWHEDSWWNPKKFRSTNTPDQSYESPKEQESKFFREFSELVLGVKSDVEPVVAKGDKSKSVLFDACRLAKQLQLFGEEEQWKITSKVWVELLCYAAVRCSPRSHIAQLSKGGELITFVWLYMAHLGLGERFLQNQGFGRTRLIIHK